MALAIVLGAVAGFVGFIPLAVALRLSRLSDSAGNMMATAGQSLLGVFVSLVVLGAALFACSRLAKDYILSFGLTEIIVFVAASVVYFMWRNRVIRRKPAETNEGEVQ